MRSSLPLTLSSVAKSYGDTLVLEDLSLELEAGKLLTLLGPSGCGKTTTLNIIAGLLEPDSGRVLFGERDVTRLVPEKRKLGMVFQRYALFPHMSVFNNVAFGLKVRGFDAAETRRRVGESLALVQLTGFENRYPKQLSGGQQQRVAIARTLVTEPDVLLLDEPLSNLDASLREELRGFIRTLQQQLNLTTVFVTHDQQEALEVADLIGVMFAGRLEQLGTPEAIFESPATLQVAQFMGARNFIPILEFGNAGRCAKTSLGEFSLGSPQNVEGDSLLMIRPERLELSHSAQQRENTFAAKLRSRRYMGAALRYEVQLKDTVFSVETQDATFSVGEDVSLYFPAQHLRVVKQAVAKEHMVEHRLAQQRGKERSI